MDDVEDVIEHMPDAQACQYTLGMGDRAVCEHQLAPGQSRKLRTKRGILGNDAHIKVMHMGKKILGRHIVQLHETRQRCSMLAEIVLLKAIGLVSIDAQEIADEPAHAHVHLREEIAGRRIERVVEIENPLADMLEIRLRRARGYRHEPRSQFSGAAEPGAWKDMT